MLHYFDRNKEVDNRLMPMYINLITWWYLRNHWADELGPWYDWFQERDSVSRELGDRLPALCRFLGAESLQKGVLLRIAAPRWPSETALFLESMFVVLRNTNSIPYPLVLMLPAFYSDKPMKNVPSNKSTEA